MIPARLRYLHLGFAFVNYTFILTVKAFAPYFVSSSPPRDHTSRLPPVLARRGPSLAFCAPLDVVSRLVQRPRIATNLFVQVQFELPPQMHGSRTPGHAGITTMSFIREAPCPIMCTVMITPARWPRSLNESPDYNPAWRHFQVVEYLRCRRRASECGEMFVVPLSERDPWVRAFYKFKSDIPTPRTAVFRYAQDCHDSNDRAFMASRIKATTIAGLSTTQIAGRLHTSPENIDAFHKMFFDVAAYVDDRGVLGAILAPMIESSTATDARERVWLLAALKLGVKGLDYVMDQRVKLSAAEQDEIGESIHAILAEQSLAYSLGMQSRPDAGAEAMAAYQKSTELRLRLPPRTDDAKSQAFMADLIRISKESMAQKEAERTSVGNKAVRIQAAA